MTISTFTPNDIAQKTVLVRVDFNVPLKKIRNKLVVASDSRILAALPTLKVLLKQKAKIILISHLGRPKGEPNPELSLAPVATHLSKLLGSPVQFCGQTVGTTAQQASVQLQPGQILMLENTRFEVGEKKNDPKLARTWASYADVYINEAFSAAHRAHASTVGITHYLPSFAGIHFTAEVEHLSELLTNPKRPFVMVVGGRKISDKIDAVRKLTELADVVLVGGGVANNFLKAEGHDVYKSFTEDSSSLEAKQSNTDYVKVAEEMIEQTKSERVLLENYIPLPKILYPTDVWAAESIDARKPQLLELTNGDEHFAAAKSNNIMFLDIGPKTSKLYSKIIQQAETIFWNGPMGVFEKESFSQGTKAIAHAIANASGRTILGGGDTIAAVHEFESPDRFDYISAAGGAALEFLAGGVLPGVEPLLVKSSAGSKKK